MLEIPSEQIDGVAMLVTQRLCVSFLPEMLQRIIVSNVVKAVLRGLSCALTPQQRYASLSTIFT